MPAFVTSLLAIPGVRLMVQEVLLRLFAEVLYGKSADPVFRDGFLENSRKLAGAQTEEEKKAILTAARGGRK